MYEKLNVNAGKMLVVDFEKKNLEVVDFDTPYGMSVSTV